MKNNFYKKMKENKEPYIIADGLYNPGYIAGFSAIKHWDFTEQIIESVTYFTSKNVKKSILPLTLRGSSSCV